MICAASPGTPISSADPTVAFSAVHVRRSGAALAGTLASIRPKSTSLKDRPTAPGLAAGPLTPANASTSAAPIVSRSTDTVEASASSSMVVVRSTANAPSAKKKPKTPMSSVPSARSTLPSAPSKSMSIESPPPVATVSGVTPKSTTVVLPKVLRVPPPWLISTIRLVPVSVRSGIPISPAEAAVAFSAVHVRRSVAPSRAFAMARAMSTSSSVSPMAAPLSAGPLMPANAVTSDAPMVSRSTFTGVGAPPSVTLIVAALRSMAKWPEAARKPNASSVAEPLARVTSPAWSKLMSTAPAPVGTVTPVRVSPVRFTSTLRLSAASVRPSTPTSSRDASVPFAARTEAATGVVEERINTPSSPPVALTPNSSAVPCPKPTNASVSVPPIFRSVPFAVATFSKANVPSA